MSKLPGSVEIEYSLARQGAERLWSLLHSEEYVAGLGALTSYQAVKHQAFVGTGDFDAVQNVITSNQTNTSALVGSTKEAQF